jgi:hypothetical protein
VRSFGEFQQIFGGLWQPSLLGYSVEQFFDNGGRDALIVRVVNGAGAATLTLPAEDGDALVLRALRPGTREYLRASVDYDNIPEDGVDQFNLTIQRVGTQSTVRVEYQESFRNLSVRSGSGSAAEAALEVSQLVRLAAPPPRTRPRRTLDPASGLASAYIHSNPDGDDGDPLTDYDVIGSAREHTGVFALDAAAHFSFLVIPPLSRDADLGAVALLVAAAYCRRRHALLLVDPPLAWQTADDALAAIGAWNFATEDAFMYFPRILAHDKLRGRFETFAPSGAVAGMLARGGPVAPAWANGECDDAVLRPGYRPGCLVTERLRAALGKAGINVLQPVRTPTASSMPARTLAGSRATAVDWQHLATRRFVSSVIASIAAGTREPARGEPPETAAARARAYLQQLHAAGAFGERSAEEAFFVMETSEHDPEGEGGRVVLVVGIAAWRRGEYHGFRIVHGRTATRIQPMTVNRLRDQGAGPGELQWGDGLAAQWHSGSPAR